MTQAAASSALAVSLKASSLWEQCSYNDSPPLLPFWSYHMVFECINRSAVGNDLFTALLLARPMQSAFSMTVWRISNHCIYIYIYINVFRARVYLYRLNSERRWHKSLVRIWHPAINDCSWWRRFNYFNVRSEDNTPVFLICCTPSISSSSLACVSWRYLFSSSYANNDHFLDKTIYCCTPPNQS